MKVLFLLPAKKCERTQKNLKIFQKLFAPFRVVSRAVIFDSPTGNPALNVNLKND